MDEDGAVNFRDPRSMTDQDDQFTLLCRECDRTGAVPGVSGDGFDQGAVTLDG
jgi:hypothetical protein